MSSVTPEEFEQLLNEEEGSTLDFKRDQYRFAKATDDVKAKLLKDILGFANAFRRAEAYILIGVGEVRGGRAIVRGIGDSGHLVDHSLQQFVNNLTNQPVGFSYEAFTFEGKNVGIIRIDQQARPIYLKRDYGGLERDKVYVRRGSSTDPTKPARPDEIALMRVGPAEQPPEVHVAFADVRRDDAIGDELTWDAELLQAPPVDEIPLLSSKDGYLGVGFITNETYLRELAHLEFVRRLFRPVRLVIHNYGTVSASDVRLEMNVLKSASVAAMEASQLPVPPKRRYYLIRDDLLPRIRPMRREPGEVEVDENVDRFRVTVECGNLQPSRRIWSEVFWLAVKESRTALLPGRIYASNLTKARQFELRVSATIARATANVDDLEAMPEPVGWPS